MRLLKSNLLKFALFSFIGTMMFVSCEKDYGKESEGLKDLMFGEVPDKVVAFTDTVKFIDLSLGVKERIWSFPSGTPEKSSEPEVDVSFETGEDPKEIEVTCEIEFVDGSIQTKSYPITVYPVLIADFVGTPVQSEDVSRILVGETVSFKNNSIGGENSLAWDFGSGQIISGSATSEEVVVQFDVNEPVNISLTAFRDFDEAAVTKNFTVQVGPPELMVNGHFEDQAINDWQTWSPDQGFPVFTVPGGAEGTSFAASYSYQGGWGFTELMSRDWTGIYRIPIENGRSYTVSLWAKADDPGIFMQWFQLANFVPSWNADLVEEAGGAVGYEAFWGTNGQELTTEWQEISFVAEIPDDGKARNNAYANWSWGGELSAGTTIYFDQVSIKIVDPPLVK